MAEPGSVSSGRGGWARRLPIALFGGLLPIERARLSPEAIAGITLAAVAVPEVLGYAKIAGMPPVTGLYTMFVPVLLFAVLGSSRHLVVGADSATAAILAAGLSGIAVAGSPHYVKLAGTAALLAGVLLVLARVVRLGFLANFLSRTVLLGFLTGVGIQVALGQLPQMLGVSATGSGTVVKFVNTLRALGHVQGASALIALAVVVVVVVVRRLSPKVPGALLAVVAAIVVSEAAHLSARRVAVLGSVPSGVPHLTAPSFAVHDLTKLLSVSLSMFVVILAQSAATSRAYAARYEESVDEDADLVGLGAANLSAAFTGTFVVNGSPTKTQIADGAGGRSQLAQVCTAVVVLLVLLLLTGPLAYLPLPALAAVVFMIGVDLVDVAGLRRVYRVRRLEFAVACITAASVVFIGVEQGIAIAVVVSVIDHLRHSYAPHSSLLVKSPAGHWLSLPPTRGGRTVDGLIVYRFGSSLYFANASRLIADILELIGDGPPPVWLCLDAAAIGDVDYTAAAVITLVYNRLKTQGSRFVLSGLIDDVRRQLDRYGITEKIGSDACFETAGEALEAFLALPRPNPAPGVP
ncbi:MAG TPA: SulP family inorganic anion transporter [Actinocrinis sp.]|uniref:SulP family inorganic anion transporter n=1 Tax=Actinocrinis sp. TaxID=1920516 RepID=UPI002DDCCE2A|nr:SulP family inorganic anion transporter [Actinocrinis sp.]HEV3173758.1 SulP family inorganic anion transporter [Actinocrinis sp.]